MKKITDNTIVKVKVPKHLYEAIQKRIALRENYEKGMKPKEEGMDHPKEEGYGKHEEPVVNENLMDMLASVDMETLGMIATALGITGGAKVLANMIKKEKANIGGITGVYTSTEDDKKPS